MAVNKNKEAKDQVSNRIATLFGSDYIDTISDKVYVWGKAADGTQVQVAISLTCPNVQIKTDKAPVAGFDWSDSISVPNENVVNKPTSESDIEKENLNTLLKNLGF